MPVESFEDIHGWFYPEDVALFKDILGNQQSTGTVVELGAFLGRSTALMGHYLRDGEEFVVVDLFGLEPEDVANAAENKNAYKNVDPNEHRREFEENYTAVHGSLPTVVQALSTEVVNHVGKGEARFVHIDASHLYEHVAADIQAVRDLMQSDGVVVLDDYRAVHTPGVAAAAWEAVANFGLVPFALSPFKMYATWGDATEHRERAWRLGSADPNCATSRQEILGHDVVRLENKPVRPTPPPAPRMAPADVKAVAKALSKDLTPKLRAASRPSRSRSDWAPPVLVEWVRSRRSKKR